MTTRDLDQPGTFADVLRRLEAAQKPPATGSPAYSRYVNRRIGRVLAAACFRAGLTPNHVTGISALFSAAAIIAIATVAPSGWSGTAIAAALLVGYAFDSADGQVARLRGGGSPAGEWLDHLVDSVKTSALHLAVLIGWFRFLDLQTPLLLIPIGFTLVGAVFFFIQILTDQLRRAHPGRAPAPAGRGLASALRSIAVIPTDYGLLCLIFLLLGWTPGFVTAYALLLAGTTLFLFAALPKWYREMRRLKQAG